MIVSVNSTITNSKVIIYGGSFNPPTNAHFEITKACCQLAEEIGAKVWLLPSGSRPDKTINTEVNTRLKYLECFKQSLKEFGYEVHLETSEIYNNRLTETIDTVRKFKKLYPKQQFIWVFGADSFVTMKQWRDGDKLWNELDMLAVPRSGYNMPDLPDGTKILKVNPPSISSTEVRKLLAEKKSIYGLVPKPVNDFIDNNH